MHDVIRALLFIKYSYVHTAHPSISAKFQYCMPDKQFQAYQLIHTYHRSADHQQEKRDGHGQLKCKCAARCVLWDCLCLAVCRVISNLPAFT
eukprot:5512869-Pleurochrysis_carterae.AAC.1